MKYLYLIVFIIFSFNAKAQEDIHWLINQDSKTDCSFIKSGKFVNEESENKITEGYTIEFRGETIIEKVDYGKYFVKSKINYTSECSYEMKVLESNIPEYEDVIGKTFYAEILETAKSDNLIKIRSKGDEWKVFVLKKIEN